MPKSLREIEREEREWVSIRQSKLLPQVHLALSLSVHFSFSNVLTQAQDKFGFYPKMIMQLQYGHAQDKEHNSF